MGWREWKAVDAAMNALERTRKRAALDLACIETDQDLAYCEILNSNPRYRGVVDSFLDLRGYRKDARSWEKACGTDRGLWKRTRAMAAQWPRFWAVLLLSRKMRRNRR